MEKLYEEKPDRKEFDARVLTCESGKNGFCYITLDQTAFYPEGGGQPFDTGALGDGYVAEVHEKDGHIVHYVDKALEPGSRVHGVIDWDRRQSHMQNHTGEHIVSGLVHRHFGYDNVGFHMGQDVVTIDFNGMLTMEQALELEMEANRLVWSCIPVEAWYPPEEELRNLDYRSKKELTGPVRIVRIEGGDTCACCGTHVSDTGEVGVIKITGLKKYKSGVRMEMVCGFKALSDYRKKQEQVTKISALLSAKQGEVAGAVERLMEESSAAKRQISQLYQQIFRLRCQALPENDRPLLIFEEDLPPAMLRRLTDLLCQEGKGDPILACSGHDKEYYYVIGSRKEKVERDTSRLNELLNGKGSGKGMMAQGKFEACEEEIRQIWNQGLWRE